MPFSASQSHDAFRLVKFEGFGLVTSVLLHSIKKITSAKNDTLISKILAIIANANELNQSSFYLISYSSVVATSNFSKMLQAITMI